MKIVLCLYCIVSLNAMITARL